MERSRHDREVLLAALEAGKLLLENGAEIFRVEETIYRICKHFGLTSASAFVLSNGIFLTSGDEEEKEKGNECNRNIKFLHGTLVTYRRNFFMGFAPANVVTG